MSGRLLDDQLYLSWLLQLQTWAADGRLLVAGLDALQLKPGQATDQLKRVVERLAKGDTRDLPPIELLPGSAMPGAAGAYAKATKKIYINQEWIKTASEADAIRLLTEEFGHHLDNQLKEEDSPGDEGAIFAERLLNSYPKGAISSAQTDLIDENDLDNATEISKYSFLFEEFLIRHPISDHKKRAGKVVVHQHCHAKVLSSKTALQKMLEQWGFEVVMVDAGCCGMAGSFGYEHDKYEVSIDIGRERLFPALQLLGKRSKICVPGFSCRHQIMDGIKKKAFHPAELIAQQL